MALTAPQFQQDAVLDSVSDGRRTLRVGESGQHIERLQAALAAAEFPSFDPKGSYSSGTSTAIAALKDYYFFYFYFGALAFVVSLPAP